MQCARTQAYLEEGHKHGNCAEAVLQLCSVSVVNEEMMAREYVCMQSGTGGLQEGSVSAEEVTHLREVHQQC